MVPSEASRMAAAIVPVTEVSEYLNPELIDCQNVKSRIGCIQNVRPRMRDIIIQPKIG